MARGLLPEAVTAEDVIQHAGEIYRRRQSFRTAGSRSRNQRKPAQTTSLNRCPGGASWGSADRNGVFPPVPVVYERYGSDPTDYCRRHDRTGKPSNDSIRTLYSLALSVCYLYHPEIPPKGLCLTGTQAKRKLAKRTVVAAVLVLLMIPLTLYIGVFYLDNKKYYFISLLVLLECMLPLFPDF